MKLLYTLNNSENADKSILDNYNYFLHTLLPNNINIHSLYQIDNDIIEYVKNHFIEMRYLIFVIYKHLWYKKRLFIDIQNNLIICKFKSSFNFYDYTLDEESLKHVFLNKSIEENLSTEEIIIKNNKIFLKKINLYCTYEAYAYLYLHVIKIINLRNLDYLFILGIIEGCIEINIISIPYKQIQPKNYKSLYNFQFSTISLKSLYVTNQIKIFKAWKNNADILITGGTGIGKTSQIPKLLWWINFLYDGYDINLNFNKFEFNLINIQNKKISSRSTVLSLPRKILITENALNVSKSLGYKDIINSPINCAFKDVQTTIFYNPNINKIITPFIFSINRVTKLENVNTLIFDEVHEHDTFADIGITKAKYLKIKNNIKNIVLISATISDDIDNLKSFFPNMVYIHIEGETLFEIKELYLTESLEQIISRFSINKGKSTIVFLPSVSSINNWFEKLTKILDYNQYVILTLYRTILLKKNILKEIYQYPNKHVIILSTPIAESSLTIKNAEIVIDYGLFYCKQFFSGSIMRITDSMMVQRKGRIGRISKGIYIRLFTLEQLNKSFKRIDYEFLLPYIINCIYYNIKFSDIFVKPSDMSRFNKTLKYFKSKNVDIVHNINKIYYIYNMYFCTIPEYIIIYLQKNQDMTNLLNQFENENLENKIKLILLNRILFIEIAKLMNINVKLKTNDKVYLEKYYEHVLPINVKFINLTKSQKYLLIAENIVIK